MIDYDAIREESYAYFLTESQDLLQEVEAGLLNLQGDRSPNQVHQLMRAAHTLKGAAASVDLNTIQHIAHVMEDIFRALYNPEIEIDTEVEAQLFQGYECLRIAVLAAVNRSEVDDAELKNRTAAIITKLQEKLGDCFEREAAVPTSAELGFDMVQSMFEMGVAQRLEELENDLLQGDAAQIADSLQAKAAIFLGLAESLDLPGFGAISQTVAAALAAHPDQAIAIAELALEDFSQGQQAVLQGDRSQGGSPSPALQALAGDSGKDPFAQGAADPSASAVSFAAEEMALLQDPFAELAAAEEDLHPQAPFFPDLTDPKPKEHRPFQKPSPAAISPDFDPEAIDELLSESAPSETFTPAATPDANPVLDLLGSEADSASGLLIGEEPGDVWDDSLVAASYTSDPSPISEVEEFSLDRLVENVVPDEAEDQFGTPLTHSEDQPDSEDQSDRPDPPISEQSETPDASETEISPDLNMPDLNRLVDEVEAATSYLVGNGAMAEIEPRVPSGTSPVKMPAETPTTSSPALAQSAAQSAARSPARSPARSSARSSGHQSAAAPSVSPPADGSALQVAKALPAPRKSRHPELASPAADSHKEAGNKPVTPTIRVDLTQLERLDHLAGELLINQNRQTEHDRALNQTLRHLIDTLRQHQQTVLNLRDWSDRSFAGSSLRPRLEGGGSQAIAPKLIASLTDFDALELDRYNELHLLVQSALDEAVQLEDITEQIETFNRQSHQTLTTQQRLLTHVRDDLTSARMQRLGVLLNRFPRVVQQLASLYKKQVELVVKGSNILVDKAIVEKLYDPLLHLVRNAFDHGIEPPEVRQAQGKPETGTIEIHAYSSGNRTYIDIRDDGAGLDLQKIRDRAVVLNWYTPDEVRTLPDEQLVDLMFQPGFSTAAAVSDLSGRGVGLDVVRSQLNTLKGKVSVYFIPGEGTTFSLRIPISITITKLLVCQAGSIPYALPIENIQQVLIPRLNQIKLMSSGRSALIWRDGDQESLIPLHQLSRLLDYSATSARFPEIDEAPTINKKGIATLQAETNGAAATTTPVLLLQTVTGVVGIQVDRVLGEQELVIRPLGSGIAAPPYVYGCSILSNSRLALVLDAEVLIRNDQPIVPTIGITSRINSAPPALLPSSTAQANPDKTVLLVVDDSLTLRRNLTLLLQQVGYQVVQASNGLEALKQVQDHHNIATVICDVEMPQMNGFEFLSEFRKQPEFAKIPVVMLTSRTPKKYRTLALELGASAYVTKPYSEQELLETLEKVASKLSGSGV